MGAGDDAGGPVLPGEVGERPHRVAHGRGVGLGDRHQHVVGVDGLWRLARADVDRRQRRDQAPGVENPLDDRQYRLVHRHLLPQRTVDKEVVDPQRLRPLEVIGGGDDLELALEVGQVGGEVIEEVGRDGVLDDRVPVLLDALEMRIDCRGVHPGSLPRPDIPDVIQHGARRRSTHRIVHSTSWGLPCPRQTKQLSVASTSR